MALQDSVDEARREEAKCSAQAKEAKERAKYYESELGKLQKEFDVLAQLSKVSGRVLGISARGRTRGNRAIPHLMLSDLHFDEVVRTQEVEGVNAYNREIATQRLERTFTSTVRILRDYWSNLAFDGVHVILGGDTFSGNIHDELKETNADTIFGSMLYWQDHVLAGLNLLAEEFGKVHVTGVVGNHGRNTRKPRAKFRARDNFDWFFSMQLARILRDDKRFTFNIPESMDATIRAYDKTIRVTHGDQVTGGDGIGGIWPVIMRLNARKQGRQMTLNNPYDLLVMGHFHQLVFGQNFIVNGSLKGYDEYAYSKNFGYEPAAQALWLMVPEKGRTWQTPVWSEDRNAEGW